MSNRSIGRKYELKAKKELEDTGYEVHLVDMPKKWKKNMDLFVFDIIAIKPKETRWIQVTKGSTKGKLKQLKDFQDFYQFPKGNKIELWRWRCGHRGKKGEWQIYEFN